MKNIIEPSQKVDYDDVFETIQNDAQKRGLSDDKVWEIWQAGIAAQQSVKKRIGGWACPKCGFANNVGAIKCGGCGTANR